MNSGIWVVNLIAFLEFALLFTAFQITVNGVVKDVIRSYRRQSIILAVAALLTTLQKWNILVEEIGFGLAVAVVFLITALPLGLGLLIEPVLARATVFSPESLGKETSGRRPFITFDQRQLAERTWLQYKSKPRVFVGILFLFLVGLSSGIAFLAAPQEDLALRLGLLVSIALHLIGLLNTSTRGDIITQVIGLLTMDHGLYLAVVKIVAIPVPATFFILSLYAYTMITIVILIYIVPHLRHATGKIDLDEISEYSELKG